MSWIKQLPMEGYVLPGASSCVGCGAILSLRLILRISGRQTVLIIPACCSSIIQGSYPKTAFKIPVLNVALASSAAVASGVVAAFRTRGIEGANVIVWAGDGGTADIGIQALSGAAHRQENILYVCYDNEGYMNTGIQESGSTPFGAWTTNSPRGKRLFKKNMPFIMMGHKIPYLATANISYPQDLVQKVRKALKHVGFKYIHLYTACPPGWRIPADETINIGKLAVKTGVWALFEIENGKFRLTGPSARILKQNKRKPLEEYLRIQGRYRKMTDEDVKILKERIDKAWKSYSELHKLEESLPP
jgi:pyruvate ferredoxin oxidoreductase beta subunit